MRVILAIVSLVSSFSFAAIQGKDMSGYLSLKNGHQLFVDYKAPQNDMPTLVFVNGLTFSTRDYGVVAGILTEQGYGVLLYDAYGMGRTLLKNPMPTDPIKVETQVAELDEVLKKMNIPEPFNLVGLSYGGGILTAYATTFPSKIKTLFMVSPYTEVIEESKQIVLKQIAQTRQMFPSNPATDEELANYFIRQFVYQNYPIFEPSVLENPFKLEGIVKLVQGITPFRPIDLAGDLPAHSVHMMIGAKDEYVKPAVYEKFWNVVAPAAKCSYVSVEDSSHKVITNWASFSAHWINYVLQSKDSCQGIEFSADPLLMKMTSSSGKTFKLPEFKKN